MSFIMSRNISQNIHCCRKIFEKSKFPLFQVSHLIHTPKQFSNIPTQKYYIIIKREKIKRRMERIKSNFIKYS